MARLSRILTLALAASLAIGAAAPSTEHAAQAAPATMAGAKPAVRSSGIPALRLPGPAPQNRTGAYDVAAENGACEGCHSDIAQEWRGSYHRQAWEDSAFQKAYAIEPQSFCRGCHAPESDPAQSPSAAARHIGVGCVTCHVSGGDIIGSSGHVGNASQHAVRQDKRLATPKACQNCHQFEFLQPQRAAMQGTIEEHQRSRYRAVACQKCHMPEVTDISGKTHRSHDFSVIGNTALLRSAINMSARRSGTNTIMISLATARVGHAVPTGDMFRRLVIRAKTLSGDTLSGDTLSGDTLTAAPAVLSRKLVMQPTKHGLQRQQVSDERLKEDGSITRVELAFPEPVLDRAIQWSLVYQRMPDSMAAAFGISAAENETAVLNGALPALLP